MNDVDAWYVAVDDLTAGPAPTNLVIRGIEHRKIPPEALVCPVGARRWDPLAAVPAFHAAVVRSYPPPPPDSEEARRWMAQGFQFPPLAALPRFEYALDDGPDDPAAPDTEQAPKVVAAADDDADWDDETANDGAASGPPVTMGDPQRVPQTPPAQSQLLVAEDDWEDEPHALAAAEPDLEDDADLAVDWDVTEIDWRDPFESFFLVGDEVELPEEGALLESLATASRDTFRDESALWNLALCLAYGSDQVGTAAAQAFFDAVQEQGAVERLDWMSRTLLGNGFVHSGIPEEAGRRAVRRLRSSCPPSLTGRLAS